MQTELLTLESEHVPQTYEISVGRCSLTDEMPADVLVVTDAVIQFGAAVDIVHGLLLTGHLAPMLVVGAGYRQYL